MCVHRNSIFGDRKLSFWGTNYTSSANDLRSWVDNQYPTKSLQKSNFIERRSDINFPQQSTGANFIGNKKADVLKRLKDGKGEFKINDLHIDEDAPKPDNFGNIPEKFRKLIYDKQNTATAGVLVQDIHGQILPPGENMINIKPDGNNLIKVDQSENNFICHVSYPINITNLDDGSSKKIGDMIYKYTVNEDVFTTKQPISTEINFVFQNCKEIKIQFPQKGASFNEISEVKGIETEQVNRKFFKSEGEFNLFIQEKIDNSKFDIISKKEEFFNGLDKLGYSTIMIEKRGYIDIVYDESTQEFKLNTNSTLKPVDTSKIQHLKEDSNDYENKLNALSANSGYTASSEQIAELRNKALEFVINDKVNQEIYLNALISEVAMQFLNVDDNDPIWNNDVIELNKSNIGELGKKLKHVFPECRSKAELVNLLNTPTSLITKFDALAEICLTTPKTLVNQAIAQNFCNHIEVDFAKINLSKDHFYLASGNPEDIRADGDCFFHCISKLIADSNN